PNSPLPPQTEMSPSARSVVIHGHFYQPPREDPWLEELELQASAAPYHDWNARVEAECYRTVVAARVPGPEGRIREILNTLRFISFNFGPTLLEWMERAAPDTYRSILEADGISRRANRGHGNAIAQAYHHTILPLASHKDRVTEVRWGMEDFRRRFRRDPTGMWLPETAVDADTLDILAREGIAFTILAPHQVEPVPKGGLPGIYHTKSGRSIALFIYDGPLAHDVAFGSLLKDAEVWAARMAGDVHAEGTGRELEETRSNPTQDPGGRVKGTGAGKGTPPPPRRLVSVATDGETYGHHHRFGEMALAAVIQALRSRPEIHVENFSSFLAHSPPEEEVSLVEPTSWSCIHGVGRWRGDCGCKMDPWKETQQEWRSGLRDAMEWLSEELHRVFEAEAPALLGDPWASRNEYAQVVSGSDTIEEFLRQRLPPSHTPETRVRAAELLELERNALRIFTSCGWFFDDLAGIEPVQILRYAARALALAGPGNAGLEEGFLNRLRRAKSNEVPERDGATIFLQEAKPEIPALVRIAAGAVALARMGKAVPFIRGFRTDLDGEDAVRVSEPTTGRSWILKVEVEGTTPRNMRMRVRDTGEGFGENLHGDTEYFLEVPDLPEAFRESMEELALQEALDRWVLPEDQAALLAGRVTLGEILNRALVSAVREIGAQENNAIPDPAILLRVEELALLHTQRGLPIPFDAQTDFYHIKEAASPKRSAALNPLQGPLGFVLEP
ncbi:MAG: DUF3536 domain-containing protein, partial [Longimicrobiales bacterium]